MHFIYYRVLFASQISPVLEFLKIKMFLINLIKCEAFLLFVFSCFCSCGTYLATRNMKKRVKEVLNQQWENFRGCLTGKTMPRLQETRLNMILRNACESSDSIQ